MVQASYSKDDVKTNLDLHRLRSGDFIDPVAVVLIAAGYTHPDRPYWTGDGQPYTFYCRVESKGGSWIMVPCNDWAGAVKFRNTLAEACNRARRNRRTGPTVTHETPTANGGHLNSDHPPDAPPPAAGAASKAATRLVAVVNRDRSAGGAP